MSLFNFIRNFFKSNEDLDINKINQLNRQFIDNMKQNPILSDTEKAAIITANEEIISNSNTQLLKVEKENEKD